MADGAILLDLAACDLALQHGNPRIELGDRQWIEVLPHERVEQVVGTGRGVIRFHSICNVDPHQSDVNKARKSKGT